MIRRLQKLFKCVGRCIYRLRLNDFVTVLLSVKIRYSSVSLVYFYYIQFKSI